NRLPGYSFPQTSSNNSGDVIILKVALSRPVIVNAGQSICLWVLTPSAKLRSLWQMHPFVVASWSNSPLETFDLLVEPRSGLTQKFLQFSKSQKAPKTCISLFSGPHGTSIPVTDYDVVLMVASGYGIAAQLPYLKKLIYEFNSRKARTRRIHLVWKLHTIGKTLAAGTLCGRFHNSLAYAGEILKISIYIEHISQSHGSSSRATIVKGIPDFDAILREEVEGKYIRRVQEKEKKREDMMVLGKSALQLTHAVSNPHSIGIG
ncbi:hypothetical protein LX36DRAFT_727987, partial [Colletotrichum falcatum]